MKKFFALVFLVFIFSVVGLSQPYNDAALLQVRLDDQSDRESNGQLLTLSATEHNYRAEVYAANRVFAEAREHWQKLLERYPNDPLSSKALFGIARSFMWERNYAQAVLFFDKLLQNSLTSKEARDGLAFKGACLVRLGKNVEAAKTYEQYTVMFPFGEKIDSSYLNIIDALREAKQYDDANLWVDKTRQRFSEMPTEITALHSRLRLELFRGNWLKANEAADQIRSLKNFTGSMTSLDEVTFLKAFALERLGRKDEAISLYSSIPDSGYFGGVASERLSAMGVLLPMRFKKTAGRNSGSYLDFPVVYRAELLRQAKSRGIDPRFVLAVMKQESSFRANAKSPAAARGLLQLTYDTALKYSREAGFPNLQPEDLYRPDVNIAIASIYIAALKKEFNNLYEPIAASYNGGEDNAARWLFRSQPKDPAIFVSEIGFAETKNYTLKVMTNYRIYRQLYTENLTPR